MARGAPACRPRRRWSRLRRRPAPVGPSSRCSCATSDDERAPLRLLTRGGGASRSRLWPAGRTTPFACCASAVANVVFRCTDRRTRDARRTARDRRRAARALRGGVAAPQAARSRDGARHLPRCRVGDAARGGSPRPPSHGPGPQGEAAAVRAPRREGARPRAGRLVRRLQPAHNLRAPVSPSLAAFVLYLVNCA
jgi:hypothetical protein